MAVHEDNTGNKLTLAPPPGPKGFISCTVGVKDIYKNMCGYFWQINKGVFDVSGQKIWVVLYEGVLNVYDSPHDRRCLYTIDCDSIVDMEEKKYEGLEIAVDGVVLRRVSDSLEGVKVFSEVLWAWGDDHNKTKGLWRRALINKKAHEALKDTPEYQASVKLSRSTKI